MTRAQPLRGGDSSRARLRPPFGAAGSPTPPPARPQDLPVGPDPIGPGCRVGWVKPTGVRLGDRWVSPTLRMRLPTVSEQTLMSRMGTGVGWTRPANDHPPIRPSIGPSPPPRKDRPDARTEAHNPDDRDNTIPDHRGRRRRRGGRVSLEVARREARRMVSRGRGARLAENVLSHQSARGDWPKNLDTSAGPFRGDRSHLRGTFDNGATVGEMRFLRESSSPPEGPDTARLLPRRSTISWRQYPNGGWPQSHPSGNGYARYITFNDNTMVNILELVRDVARSDDFRFVDRAHREAADRAFAAGVTCILKCQVQVDGRLTVGVRSTTKDTEAARCPVIRVAVLSGGESAGILLLLLSLENPSPDVVRSIRAGVKWYEDAKITGIRQVVVNGDKKIVPDGDAPQLWARFYEIGTNRPFFCRRDGVKKDDLAGIEVERRNGYAWYGDGGAASWRSTSAGKKNDRDDARHDRPHDRRPSANASSTGRTMTEMTRAVPAWRRPIARATSTSRQYREVRNRTVNDRLANGVAGLGSDRAESRDRPSRPDRAAKRDEPSSPGSCGTLRRCLTIVPRGEVCPRPIRQSAAGTIGGGRAWARSQSPPGLFLCRRSRESCVVCRSG